MTTHGAVHNEPAAVTVDLQHYLHKIELEDTFIRRSAMVEAERAAAIRDLIDKNTFFVEGDDRGPYFLRIGLDGHRLKLKIRNCLRQELPDFDLSLQPFRRLIKDYFLICESYKAAYASGDRVRLETIDMARRALHDEGADLLIARFAPVIATDHNTARCLFTLVCVLHIGKVQPW